MATPRSAAITLFLILFLSYVSLVIRPVMADPAVAAASPANAGIEEVVVTAQKRSERVQDVPIAVGVVTSTELKKQNIINIDDIAAKLPNVQAILPFGPQEPQFSIRGVTETDFQPNQSSPIAVYVDGIFKSVGALQALQLFDTDRIEVLKGPQGTLQGRNATGGAINIYSTAPNFDGLNGYITAGAGNYGRYETNGAVNIPVIADKLAIRAAWTFTNVDGYFHNVYPNAANSGDLTGVFDYGGRLSFLFKPTDDFTATLRLADARSDPVNYGEYSKDVCCGGIGIPPGSLAPYGVPQSAYSTTGFNLSGLGYGQSDVNSVHRREIKSRGLSLNMDYQVLPWLKLTSVTGYDMGQWYTNEDDDGSPFNADQARYFSRINSFQQEVRATSSFDGPYNFILGALYSRESLGLNEDTQWAFYQPAIYTAPDGTQTNICLSTGFYTCDLFNSFNQKRTDYAIYLNNTYKITPELQLTVGARWTDDSISIQDYRAHETWFDNTTGTYQSYNTLTGVLGDTTGALPNQSLSDHKWIGKVGLDYHITPKNMVYGSWSLGFRGSAFNAAAQAAAAFNGVKPETLIDYEVGSKNQFFDNRLQANIAGFYYIYRNQQFATLNSQTGLSEEVNLPKINSQGVEADLTGKPFSWLTLSGSTGYLYSIYGSGSISNPLAGFNTPNQPFSSDVTGQRVYTSPHWSFSVSADWRIFDNDYGSADLYIDGNGITKEYFNAANSPESQENGYTLWDARLTYNLPDTDASIALWTQNMFNRKYYTVIFDTESLVNYSFSERGTPQTFGVQATYRFNVANESPEPAPVAPTPAPAPEAAPPSPPAPAPEAKRAYQVFFDFDKSAITADAAAVLQQAAAAIKSGNSIKVMVIGHTDTVGSVRYNQKLSERRAMAVKAKLIGDGVSEGEIGTKGVGKTDLLVPTPDGVREPQNRRAEIIEQRPGM